MEELEKIIFDTKSILLTDKQKDKIEELNDALIDLGHWEFYNIEYWKLSKKDASKLISRMLALLQKLYDEDT